MKPKVNAIIALTLAAFSAPAFSADTSFGSRLTWAGELGTHVYDLAGAETFKPSLELGISASLPLTTTSAGDVLLEGGFSQTAIYGTSELKTPQAFEGNELSTVQLDFRRVFLSIGFETSGKWFIKPQVGVEHITAKLRLYDENTKTGYTTREGDSNGFASIGIGYRFPEGQKGVLSLATLADSDDQDYRITYSASF